MLREARVELGDHAEAEKTIGRDFLITAQSLRHPPTIPACKAVQRQSVVGRFPKKLPTARRLQRLKGRRRSDEDVQARVDAVHTMNEEREMDPRRPPERVPRRAGARKR